MKAASMAAAQSYTKKSSLSLPSHSPGNNKRGPCKSARYAVKERRKTIQIKRENGGELVALGAKFISTKVQCCGEKDSPLYCCYIAPPAPLKSTGNENSKNNRE